MKKIFSLFIIAFITIHVYCQEIKQEKVTESNQKRSYSFGPGVIFTTNFEWDMLDAYAINFNYNIHKHTFSFGPMAVINRWRSNSLNKPIIGVNGSYQFYPSPVGKLQFFAHYSFSYFQFKETIFYQPELVNGKHRLFTNVLGGGVKLFPCKKNKFYIIQSNGFALLTGADDYWDISSNTIATEKGYAYGLALTLSFNYVL